MVGDVRGLLVRVFRMRRALQQIARGNSGYRGGGGFTCDWCMNAGAEGWASSHPKTCPRTIARDVLKAAPDTEYEQVVRFLFDLREAGRDWQLEYDDGDVNVSERANALLKALEGETR